MTPEDDLEEQEEDEEYYDWEDERDRNGIPEYPGEIPDYDYQEYRAD
jgi:hypothetical protein